MKNFFRKHGLLVIAAALLVVLLSIVSMNTTPGGRDAPSAAFSTAGRPFHKAMASFVGTMENLYSYIYRYDQLEEENQQLKKRVAELEEEYREYSQVAEENEKLRELMGFSQRHKDYVLEQSSILSWSASNFASAFEISKGSGSNISVGDCVITETGSLVGMVSAVTNTTATVTTILDTTVTVGAFVYSDGEDCVAEGEFSQIRKGMLRLSYYEGEGMLASGEAVYTSGVGGICPRGLLIGNIAGYISSTGGLEDYYTIKPDTDFESLNYVYIITDFEVSE